jgi:cytochrome c oxidase assembly factor CtaG
VEKLKLLHKKQQQDNSLQEEEEEEKSLGRKVIPSIALTLSLISLLAASSSDLLEFSARNLAFHMTAEHLIFFATGALFVEVIGRLLRPVRRLVMGLKMSHIVICLMISAAILAIWHYPLLFAAALFHEELHQLQHASFIMTGAIAYTALRSMSPSYLILFCVLICGIMGLFGALLLVSNELIFFPYSIEDHAEAGNTMIILTIVVGVVLLPAILIRNSIWHELRQQ